MTANSYENKNDVKNSDQFKANFVSVIYLYSYLPCLKSKRDMIIYSSHKLYSWLELNS